MRTMICIFSLAVLGFSPILAQDDSCSAVVKVKVVCLLQPWVANRLGAAAPNGQIFALRRNVTSNQTQIDANGNDIDPDALPLLPGNVRLKSHVRPRPLVLRVNQGECLEIEFENLFPTDTSILENNWAGLHVSGLELIAVNGQPGILSDASNVGANPSSVVQPGVPITYKLYAREPGTYFAYSLPGVSDSTSNLALGLFGAVNVQPPGAEYYRSQVTREGMMQATMRVSKLRGKTLEPVWDADFNPKVDANGFHHMTMTYREGEEEKEVAVLEKNGLLYSALGQPLIDYTARFDNDPANPYVLSMCDPPQGDRELIYSDLTAIITGPNAGRFPYSTVVPEFYTNPASPDRRQPYREFTIIYHQGSLTQAFNAFSFEDLNQAFCAGQDFFGINYGFGGIGAEILANRLGVGPEGFHGDGVDLKYEEFFLSSWSVGDPAMIVDSPANTLPTPSMEKPRATQVFYPDDPSNVYHSYLRDHLKFRIINADKGPPHVHHQHAHQWLHSPDSSDSHYLDAQLITPGATYTLEMVYNGSGNRNQTVGDSIFHCHFYPHFAGGMWSLWRVHDVYETGTLLTADGKVASTGEDLPWNRALPDGEIASGTPIPALVPLPTIGMPPMPSNVRVSTSDDPAAPPVSAESLAGRRVIVEPETDETGAPLMEDGAPLFRNPGYPFFIPAVAGHRPVHPPLDFAVNDDGVELNGGLPRHQVLDGTIVRDLWTRWDFTRDFVLFSTEEQKERTQETYLAGNLFAYQVPEDGTAVEKAAMKFHATRTFATFLPNGNPGNFITNGLPPKPGAPFADPAVSDFGDAVGTPVRYKGANIQMDVVLNKKGWHYPQQRIVSLWEDVAPTISGVRPPEPFFMRADTGDTVEFWHTNLVPNYYELDDFQVRTPTDILGQHIHLVKFDVTASDGATDGFNYEDATFSPDEVRERIIALNNNETGGTGGLYNFDPITQFAGSLKTTLTIQDYQDYYPFGPEPAYQNWDGAQTTVQRWDTDPLLNDRGEDRTLRTVFTHDHLGPSTHQQIGLYAGLVVEPENSTWYTNAPSFTAPGTYQVLGPDGMLTTFESTDGMIPAGTLMGHNLRDDGGPTSWQAMIHTKNVEDSYREFMIEFGDFQLSYGNRSRSERGAVVDDTGVSSVLLNVSLCTSSVDSWVAGPVDDELKNRFCIAGIVLSDDAVLIEGLPDEGSTAFQCEALIGVDPGDVTWTVANREMIDGTPTIVDWFPMVPFTCDSGDDCAFNNTYDCLTGDSIEDPGCPTSSFKVYAPCTSPSWDDPNYALDTPGNALPAGTSLPGPTLISSPGGNRGSYSVNYRNEPIPYRVNASVDPSIFDPDADPRAVDLPFAFSSLARFDSELNTQPDRGGPIDPDNPDGFAFPQNPLNANVSDYDPYTPLMNAYVGDKIQVRSLVGAHTKNHSFTIQGVKWLFEPSYTNSGFKSMQGMGISEHFEFLFDMPFNTPNQYGFTDYLYQPSSDINGVTNGVWGLLRSYSSAIGLADGGPPLSNFPSDLLTLPNNPDPSVHADGPVAARWAEVIEIFEDGIPPDFKQGASTAQGKTRRPENFKTFDIVATTAVQAYQDVLGISINSRVGLNNPYGLIYVLEQDLMAAKTADDLAKVLNDGRVQEPLVIRVNAGDWIRVRLKNRFSQDTLFNVDYASYPVLDSDAQTLDGGTVPSTVENTFSSQGITLMSDQVTTIVSGCAWILENEAGTQKYTLIRKAKSEGSSFFMEVWDAGTPLSWVESAGSPFGADPNPTVCLTASTEVGLNPQLLSYDMGNSNGFNTGFNNTQTIGDGQEITYYWYAGNLETDESGNLHEIPVELGTVNLRPTDPLIPHKNGLFAALVVEPINTLWIEDEDSRASATIFEETEPTFLDLFLGRSSIGKALYREFVVPYVEDLNTFTGKTAADADYSASSSGSFNYKSEPLADRVSSESQYFEWQSNSVTDGQDPETPVFHALGGMETRIRILYDSGACPQVFILNGHSWQEEPWIEDSTVIGHNELSQQLGTVQILPNEPFDMVLPSAGGIDAVPGDYLLHTWLTDTTGSWSLMRVVDEMAKIQSAVHHEGELIVSGWFGKAADQTPGALRLFGLYEDGKRLPLGIAKSDATGRWQFQSPVGEVPHTVVAETAYGKRAYGLAPIAEAEVIQLD